jgi:hypothetical protein
MRFGANVEILCLLASQHRISVGQVAIPTLSLGECSAGDKPINRTSAGYLSVSATRGMGGICGMFYGF